MRILDRNLSQLPRAWRTAIDWFATITVAVLFVLVFEAEVAKPYRIPTASMEPTLNCAKPGSGCLAGVSDRVLACRICYRFSPPKRGQIVVFNTPPAAARACSGGGTYVKRLIGMPDDTVTEDEAGFILINGRRLSEPYISQAAREADTAYRGKSWHVPKNGYFMLGDNRGNSCDSRVWGAVSRDALIGFAFITYWPPQRISVR